MPTPEPQDSVDSASSTLPWWPVSIAVVGAALMIAGAVIAVVRPAMLLAPGEDVNPAARVYAGYLFSRNLAIAAMLLGTLSIGARRALSYMMVLTAMVQILDAVVDGVEGRWKVLPGVVVLGMAFFIGANGAHGKPLWRISSWRDLR